MSDRKDLIELYERREYHKVVIAMCFSAHLNGGIPKNQLTIEESSKDV